MLINLAKPENPRESRGCRYRPMPLQLAFYMGPGGWIPGLILACQAYTPQNHLLDPVIEFLKLETSKREAGKTHRPQGFGWFIQLRNLSGGRECWKGKEVGPLWVNHLLSSLITEAQSPGPALWKEMTNSRKLSSDLHV